MNTIETKVMAAVRLIYWGRKATSPTALKLYGLLASFVALRELTYLRKVVANLFDVEGVSGFYSFMTSALANAEITVLVAFFAAAVLGTLFLRDVLRPAFLRSSLAAA